MIRLAIILFALCAGPVSALTLAECTRTTHISHGGEARHVDYGNGRVGYVDWWSQEGVYTDLVVMECRSGAFLRTRVREERVSDRYFDRTDKAIEVIVRELEAAPALFSFKRLAQALDGTGRDIELAVTEEETCACAALYPEALGDKAPFVAG